MFERLFPISTASAPSPHKWQYEHYYKTLYGEMEEEEAANKK